MARAGTTSTSGRWAPVAPFEVGRFRVEQEVGLGGFGMTYAGVDSQAARPVHVTVFHPAFFADPSRRKAQRERFERAQRYAHEHLAPTWGVGEAFGTMWVATAPSPGVPLTHWRRDAAALPLDEAYRLVGQLLDAVEAIHRAGGVHGALSPDTVRIAHGDVTVTSPWWLEPVEVPADQLPPPRTAWIAPELQFGEPAESRETDVYGIGLAFGFLVACGLTEPGHSLLVQGIDVPPAVDDVYVRATARNKSQRYPDVAAFRAALEMAGGLEWRDAQKAAAPGSAPSPRDVETTAEDEAIPAFEVDGQFYPIDGGLSRARVARPQRDEPVQPEAGGRRGRRTLARTQVQGSPRSGLAPVVEVDFRRSNTLSTAGLSGPDGLPVEPVPDEVLRALLEAPLAPPLPSERPAERQPTMRPWASTLEALDVGGPVLRLGATAHAIGADEAAAHAPAKPVATLAPTPLPANDAIEEAPREAAGDASASSAAITPTGGVATASAAGGHGAEGTVYEPTVVEGIAPALLEMDIFTPARSLPPLDPFAPPAPPSDPWADSPLAAGSSGRATSPQGELSRFPDADLVPRTRPEERPRGATVVPASAEAPPIPTDPGPVSRRSNRAAPRMPTLSFDARELAESSGPPAPPPLPTGPHARAVPAPVPADAADPKAMPSLAALLGGADAAPEPPSGSSRPSSFAPPPLPMGGAPAAKNTGPESPAAVEEAGVAALLAQFDLVAAVPSAAPATDGPLFGEPRTVRDPSGPIAGAGLSSEALAAIPIRPSSVLVPATAVRAMPARKPRTLWMALAALGVGAVATLVVVLALGSSGGGGEVGGRGGDGERVARGGSGSNGGGGGVPTGGAGGGGAAASIAIAAPGTQDVADASGGDATGARAEGVESGVDADSGSVSDVASGAAPDAASGEISEVAMGASTGPGQGAPDAMAPIAVDAQVAAADGQGHADGGPTSVEVGVAASDVVADGAGTDGSTAVLPATGAVVVPGAEGIAPDTFVPKDPDALRCPDGMAKLKKKVQVTLGSGQKADDWEVTCIDRYEYPGAGAVPRTGIDLGGARAACAAKGKRLCTRTEWRRACGGTYPYGKDYDPERCNTAGADGAPHALIAAGAKGKCMSPSGAFDMVGNVAEWTSDGMVNGGTSLKNGDDATCGSSSRRAGGAPHVGFRCCADAK